MNTPTEEQPAFSTLGEIRLRKAQLMTEITKDNQRIKKHWDDIFRRPQQKKTPSKKMTNLLGTGAGILDGALLGWKLYRKLNGKEGISLFGRKW